MFTHLRMFFRPTEVEQDNQDDKEGRVSCPLEDREMSACSPRGCVMVERTSEPRTPQDPGYICQGRRQKWWTS